MRRVGRYTLLAHSLTLLLFLFYRLVPVSPSYELRDSQRPQKNSSPI